MSLNKPKKKFDLISILKDKGYSIETSRITGISKFVMEDFLSVEFLTKVLGKGDPQHREIPSLGIVGIGLRDVNMLASYPLTLDCDGYVITVPEPEAYIMQKLSINLKRKNEEKRDKDLQSIRRLLPHVDKVRMQDIFSKLFKKQQEAIRKVCEENFIDISC